MKTLLIQSLIGFVVVATAYYIANTYWFTPWKAEQSLRETKINQLKQQNDATDRFRSERDRYRQEAQALQSHYASLGQHLASFPDWAGLYGQIKNDARATRLTLTGYNNRHNLYKLGLNESPVAMNLSGAYPGIAEFLSILAQYKQILFFREADLKVNTDHSTVTISLNGVLVLDFPDQESVNKANAAPQTVPPLSK